MSKGKPMRDIPIVTLEVRAMGEQIVAAFVQHADQMAAEVERAVRLTVEGFDFEAVIRHQAKVHLNRAIEKSLEHYFTYGPGKAIVDKAVEKACTQARTPPTSG